MSLSLAVMHMADMLEERAPTHQEFLGQFIVADGRQSGQALSVIGHPAQEALIQALDCGRYKKFAWAKPVQDGGTLIMLVALLRRAIVERQTVVLAYPTGASGQDIWTTKIWPVLAAYGGQQPEKGGGSRGGVARIVQLPGGGKFILRAAGGRGESGQASITGDVLGVDEVEDWPSLHRIELISQRINESVDPMAIFCCTVKHDGIPGAADASLILALVGEGTDGRLTYPCASCGLYQPLDWAQMDLEAEVYRCACGHGWTENDRRKSFTKWKLHEEHPDHDFFTLRWSTLDSPRMSMEALVHQYRRADIFKTQGVHGPMRSFYRDRLTQAYTADQLKDDDGSLAFPTRNRIAAMSSVSTYGLTVSRREKDGDSVHLCESPAWADHHTVGVDVQDGGVRAPGRLYFVCHARGDGRSAITGYGSIIASPIGRHPTDGELHAAMARMDQLLRDWAPAAPIVAIAVDTGDGERMAAIKTGASGLANWKLIKGSPALRPMTDAAGMPISSEVPGWFYYRKGVFLIETRAVTYTCHRALLAPAEKAGSLAIPRGINREDALCKHLCGTVQYAADKWSVGERDRIHHPDWHPRHDYLDCLAYARALSHAWEIDRDQRRAREAFTARRNTQSTQSIRSPLAASPDRLPNTPRSTITREHGNRRFQ